MPATPAPTQVSDSANIVPTRTSVPATPAPTVIASPTALIVTEIPTTAAQTVAEEPTQQVTAVPTADSTAAPVDATAEATAEALAEDSEPELSAEERFELARECAFFAWRENELDEVVRCTSEQIALGAEDQALAPSLEVYLLRGEAYLMLGDYRSALPDLDEVLRRRPSGRTYSLRGDAYAGLGQSAAALDDYLSAHVQISSEPEYLIKAGDMQVLTGAYDDALNSYLLARNLGETPRVLARLARLYLHLNDLSAAVDNLDRARGYAPRDREVLGFGALLSALQEDFTAARDASERALESHPDDVDALLAQAMARTALGETEGVRELFDQIPDTYPYRLILLNARARAAVARGDFDPALLDLAASLDIDGAQADLYLLRSEIYKQLAAPQLAASDILRLADLTAESGRRFAYYVTAGDLYEQAGFHTNAVNAYREALILREDPAVSEKLANNAISAGEYELAVASFTGLIGAATEPDVLARLYYGRGRARAAAAERIRAIEDFTLAINNRETFAEAYNARALAYLAEGRERSLIVADFEKAKEHGDNKYPDPYLNLGNLYYDLNEWVPARSNYVSYQETLARQGLPADMPIQQRLDKIDVEIDTVSRRQAEDRDRAIATIGAVVSILAVIGGLVAWFFKNRG